LRPDDDIVARSGEMTKEEIVQEVMRIASTSRPALTYQIARRAWGRGMVGSRVDYD